MTLCAPGTIVLFYEQGRLEGGLVTEAAERNCVVTDSRGRSFSLPRSRFVLSSEQAYAPVDSGTLAEFLQQVAQERSSWSDEAVIASLSELPSPFDLENACRKLSCTNDIRRFALFFFMLAHEAGISHKKGFYRIRGANEREHFLLQRQLAEHRARYLRGIAAWLQGLEDKRQEPLPLDVRQTFVAELRQLQLEHEPRDLARLLLTGRQEQDLESRILSLRLLLGDVAPDSDPMAARSGIPTRFSSGLWKQARLLPVPDIESVQAFCIDAADSPDHDDAISWRQGGSGYILGIHISAVAAQLTLDSGLFAEARERVSSLYLPGETVPLLPERLSQGSFSLLAGTTRPALSLYLELDSEFLILGSAFRSDFVRIEGNLSYEEADARQATEPFGSLLRLCRRLQQERGGQESAPEARYAWNLKVQGGEIQMRRIDRLSPSRCVVEELMILYNRLLAELTSRESLPLIYRNIAAFPEPEDDEEPALTGVQAYLSTQALYHPGVGAQAYLHATSPIRRFTDIVNQAQFAAWLDSQPLPFDRAQLEEMIPAIEKRLLLLRAIAHRSERYWLLRFLRRKYLHLPLDAVLLKKTRQGWLAELSAWGKRILLHSEDLLPLQQPVKLIIDSVDLEDLYARGDVVL